MTYKLHASVASALIALGFSVAGPTQAASATATLDWFTFDTRVIALADVEPSFTPGTDFSSGTFVNLFDDADQSDSGDWTSDLSASLNGAVATITGAEFPPKTGSFDVNPQESLSAGVDGVNAAGAEAQRTLDFMLGAQTLVLFSVDYLLTVDASGLDPLSSYVNAYASMFAYAEGESFQAFVQSGASLPEDSGFKLGRLVLAVANVGEDEKSFVLNATAAAHIYAPIPEADSTAMFIAGLLLLGGVVARRRQLALT